MEASGLVWTATECDDELENDRSTREHLRTSLCCSQLKFQNGPLAGANQRGFKQKEGRVRRLLDSIGRVVSLDVCWLLQIHAEPT